MAAPLGHKRHAAPAPVTLTSDLLRQTNKKGHTRPFAPRPIRGIANPDATARPLMIGLSVAIGRFVEALFWAIFRIAGAIAGVAIVAVVGLIVVVLVVRRLLARKNR